MGFMACYGTARPGRAKGDAVAVVESSEDGLVVALRGLLGADAVSNEEAERRAYASDMWPRHQIWKMGPTPVRHRPLCVARPTTEGQIQAVVRACRAANAPLIPYGAGSGVCGGTMPIRPRSVVLDVRRLDRLVSLDDLDLTVTAEAGIHGMLFEEELLARGYTLGHYPSSILCSTLGGWLAARSAGQQSSKYGKIEDMVVSLRAVLPDGDVVETGSGQPVDWTQILVGSEGTLGVVTRATLRVHVRPEAQVFRGFRFRTVDEGLHALRRIMQAGLSPHVARLYDPFDTMLHSSSKSGSPAEEAGRTATGPMSALRDLFSAPVAEVKRRAPKAAIALALSVPGVLARLVEALPATCLLILGFDGTRSDAERDLEAATKLALAGGGIDGGSGPGERWLAHRHAVSFKQSALFDAGAFVDTMEVSAPWSRVLEVYRGVRAAVSPHAFVMAHMSHAYREGCSLYFTFAGYKGDAAGLERLYDRVWAEGLTAVIRCGGSISHHHGVGLSKRDAMRREHGAGLRLLYSMKDVLDPSGLMNPGKVLPDRAVEG